jgi:4-diphosphocytidyl-2-C-methyl-D-erythritol kinase
LKINSFAKTNLVLDLVRKRPDGFHETNFIMHELEMHDELELKELHEDKIIIECSDASVPLNEENLCWKIIDKIKKIKGIRKGIELRINKRIPPAGGLGGGSSNAAYTLKALNGLWKLNLSDEDMIGLTKDISTDACFFIKGWTCLVKGKGEIVQRIKGPENLDFIIIDPEIRMPSGKTKYIYSNFNVNEIKRHPSTREMIEAINENNRNKIADTMDNAFHSLKIKEYEKVWELIEELKGMDGIMNAVLCGAGPAIIALCEDKENAEKTGRELMKKFSEVYITSSRKN